MQRWLAGFRPRRQARGGPCCERSRLWFLNGFGEPWTVFESHEEATEIIGRFIETHNCEWLIERHGHRTPARSASSTHASGGVIKPPHCLRNRVLYTAEGGA